MRLHNIGKALEVAGIIGILGGTGLCFREIQRAVTGEKGIELSDICFQNAVVTSTYHSAAETVPYMAGRTPGVSYSPAINRVTFKGEVTDFTVDDEGIFDLFKEGDRAIVSYRRKHMPILEDADGDGVEEKTGMDFRGYQFVDARPAPTE